MTSDVDADLLVSRNADVISPLEQATLRSLSVLVAGCGSVGGSIVEPLVRLGLGTIVLADPEPFEIHNINRQACTLDDIGRSKAAVLAQRASAINPFVQTRVFADGIQSHNVDDALGGVSIVFDAIDVTVSAWEKYLLHERACHLRIPVLSGMDFGGKATLYVFDYRRRAVPFYGKATAEAHREQRFVECFRWLGYTHFPNDFLPIIRDRLTTRKPWPQVSYCVQAMGAIGTRCVLDLAMRRSVPHVVSFDTHMRTRMARDRVREALRLPVNTVRTYIASRRPPPPAAASSPRNGDELSALLAADPVLSKVLEAMRLAPSPHNTQPWELAVTPAREIRVGWTRARTVPRADPLGYGIAAALGCAVEAAASVAEIDFEPGPQLDLFAPDYAAGIVRVGELRQHSYARNRCLLELRSTDRQPYAVSDIPPSLMARCAELAAGVGARAHVLTGRRAELARATFENAYRSFMRREYVDELLAHVRTDVEQQRDATGMPLGGLGLNWLNRCAVAVLRTSPFLRRMAPTLGLARVMAASVAATMARSGAYVLVAATADSAPNRVAAGRALMRVWLELTSQGYACQPMDFPICTPDGQRVVADMFGLREGAQPLALLRMGRALRPGARQPPRLAVSAFCRVIPHL